MTNSIFYYERCSRKLKKSSESHIKSQDTSFPAFGELPSVLVDDREG